MLSVPYIITFKDTIHLFKTMNAVTKAKKAYFPPKTTSFATQQAPNPISSRNDHQNLAETHFISLIHSSKSTPQLKSIHAQVLRRCLHIANSRITTQLISASSQHGSINYALSIFRSSCYRNLFIFNAIIRGLCENSCFESSIEHFKLMLRLGVRPDRLTFPFVLKSVMGLRGKGCGAVFHCGVFKMGLDCDSFVRVSLADMYVKIGLLDYALQVFNESPERNKVESVLLWNVVIDGCCKGGKLSKAVQLFEEMPERNAGSWNSLINGLMRSGEVNKAIEFFDGMDEKNVVSWTTVIHGLMLNGLHEKALELFFKMVDIGVKPNDLTIVSALSACAKIGALEAGIRIHNNMLSYGFRMNAAVGNALLDMYAKCGDIESASQVFNGMKVKDIRTWSVMIWGWAIHGCADKAIQCFEMMILSGIRPDEVVFLSVLTACSHAGRVDQGLNIFNSMKVNYCMVPTMKHYAVIVDLYGRAGQLDEALKFIERMPLEPDHIIWGALFCACRACKNIEMAKYATDKLLKLEPKHPGSYIFLSNVYAGVGKWDDVERVRTSMKSKDVEKDPGWSSMEVDGQVHTFVAGDRAHSLACEIYAKLEDITGGARQQGYMPETEWVLHNIEEEEKEDALGSHSEKLALAFGLISTGPSTVIRIVKNLRVCGDCHSLMKHVSKMNQREIVLRDMKRFHHFKDGVCSCHEYW